MLKCHNITLRLFCHRYMSLLSYLNVSFAIYVSFVIYTRLLCHVWSFLSSYIYVSFVIYMILFYEIYRSPLSFESLQASPSSVSRVFRAPVDLASSILLCRIYRSLFSFESLQASRSNVTLFLGDSFLIYIRHICRKYTSLLSYIWVTSVVYIGLLFHFDSLNRVSLKCDFICSRSDISLFLSFFALQTCDLV